MGRCRDDQPAKHGGYDELCFFIFLFFLERDGAEEEKGMREEIIISRYAASMRCVSRRAFSWPAPRSRTAKVGLFPRWAVKPSIIVSFYIFFFLFFFFDNPRTLLSRLSAHPSLFLLSYTHSFAPRKRKKGAKNM